MKPNKKFSTKNILWGLLAAASSLIIHPKTGHAGTVPGNVAEDDSLNARIQGVQQNQLDSRFISKTVAGVQVAGLPIGAAGTNFGYSDDTQWVNTGGTQGTGWTNGDQWVNSGGGGDTGWTNGSQWVNSGGPGGTGWTNG